MPSSATRRRRRCSLSARRARATRAQAIKGNADLAARANVVAGAARAAIQEAAAKVCDIAASADEIVDAMSAVTPKFGRLCNAEPGEIERRVQTLRSRYKKAMAEKGTPISLAGRAVSDCCPECYPLEDSPHCITTLIDGKWVGECWSPEAEYDCTFGMTNVEGRVCVLENRYRQRRASLGLNSGGDGIRSPKPFASCAKCDNDDCLMCVIGGDAVRECEYGLAPSTASDGGESSSSESSSSESSSSESSSSESSDDGSDNFSDGESLARDVDMRYTPNSPAYSPTSPHFNRVRALATTSDAVVRSDRKRRKKTKKTLIKHLDGMLDDTDRYLMRAHKRSGAYTYKVRASRHAALQLAAYRHVLDLTMYADGSIPMKEVARRYDERITPILDEMKRGN